MKYPEVLQKLIESFMQLPGVGPKTAERYAFFVIQKMTEEQVKDFSTNLIEVSSKIKKCKICGNLTDDEVCNICKDETRESVIMVVESSKEINVFEKTNGFKGKYHVLNGLISPINGTTPDKININSLFDRIANENISKVIISTSANIPGEMTAMYIKSNLINNPVEVYRIGYGLPAGGDIEYADEVTLMRALEGKKEM